MRNNMKTLFAAISATRDEANTAEVAVNALTDVEAVKNFTW